ncbi:MAG: Alw26I/Eco31I/Esp3I family type II restriction endonuclease [Solirubrobacterales bacterium]|nr:Alw26I/Eco31I/Esp3I family type II restriction endonuclease [Solirubrobacterales bacterium]
MEADSQPPVLPRPDARHNHGDSRRAWSPEFVSYAYALVASDEYRDMPCTTDEDGKVDWTIPTGRARGSKNWDGNQRRKDWWREKAADLGIREDGHWISRVARELHPWGWKPCQTCGRWMRLSYSYPTARTIARLNEGLDEEDLLELSDFLDIYEIADHLFSSSDPAPARRQLESAFPELVPLASLSVDEVKGELEAKVVKPQLRGRLSPGAMSNPPDRLDGFHTYNLCCRSTQDTGRTVENLRTYGVDRRAFEHWSEGNWEAANVLMNQAGPGECPLCGEFSKLSADHIGPISLGFQHSVYFEAICVGCNSGKNNRMRFRDITALRAIEERNESVVSWQARSVWSRVCPR